MVCRAEEGTVPVSRFKRWVPVMYRQVCVEWKVLNVVAEVAAAFSVRGREIGGVGVVVVS